MANYHSEQKPPGGQSTTYANLVKVLQKTSLQERQGICTHLRTSHNAALTAGRISMTLSLHSAV